MSSVVSQMTTSELLALPDEGVVRLLIRGNLKEREITKRNRLHAATESLIVHALMNWLEMNQSCSIAISTSMVVRC